MLVDDGEQGWYLPEDGLCTWPAVRIRPASGVL